MNHNARIVLLLEKGYASLLSIQLVVRFKSGCFTSTLIHLKLLKHLIQGLKQMNDKEKSAGLLFCYVVASWYVQFAVLLCCAVLVLCCAVLCCAVLCCAVLCCAVLVLFIAVLCCAGSVVHHMP